jgi:hypothetical protein
VLCEGEKKGELSTLGACLSLQSPSVEFSNSNVRSITLIAHCVGTGLKDEVIGGQERPRTEFYREMHYRKSFQTGYVSLNIGNFALLTPLLIRTCRIARYKTSSEP